MTFEGLPRSHVFAFLKIGERQYMDDLLQNGTIYCNTVRHFCKTGGDVFRNDPHEGLGFVYQNDVEITLGTKWLFGEDLVLNEKTGLTAQVDFRDASQGRLNIYCLYGISQASLIGDKRNFVAGPWCVIAQRVPFLERVKNAFLAARVKGVDSMEYRSVKYVKREVHAGVMAPFCKYDTFAYQSEFRIVVSPGVGKPYSFRIGSIEDIAQLVRCDDINNFLYRDWQEGQAQRRRRLRR